MKKKSKKIAIPVMRTPVLHRGIIGSPSNILIVPRFKTGRGFKRELIDLGFKISDGANYLLSRREFRTSIPKAKVELDLVFLSTAQLVSSHSSGITEEIFLGAAEIGLVECPAVTGPELRKVWRIQSDNSGVNIGMKPIAHFDEIPGVFVVENSKATLWLATYNAEPQHVWHADTIWVFAKPRTFPDPKKR